MESLLHWGIANTDTTSPEHTAAQQAAHDRIQSLDPALIDAILGKPDSVLMREAMALATDTGRTIAERVQALDDLEMLVESLDNANDLAKLGLWAPIMQLMQAEDEALQRAALWVAGTAISNNPQAQADFLALQPEPIALLLGKVREGQTGGLRGRAVYTLSAGVRHNAAAVERMGELGGWGVLKGALTDPDINVRRKVAFLLNTLLLLDGPSPSSSTSAEDDAAPHPHAQKEFPSSTTNGRTRAALQSSGILLTLIRSLHPTQSPPHGPNADERGDVDYEEKAGRVLVTYLDAAKEAGQGQVWTEEEKQGLREVVRGERERLWLDEGEWERLKASVQ